MFFSCVFKVNESLPFSIALNWKASTPDSENSTGEPQHSSTVVFPKGNPIPSIKALTFYRSSTFSVDVVYPDVNDLQAPPNISTYTVSLTSLFVVFLKIEYPTLLRLLD